MLIRVLKRLSYQKCLLWAVDQPAAVIVLVAGITLIFASLIPWLSFKTSVYDLQIEDLPETLQYHQFKDQFGSDEIIRVVVKAENVFAPATFEKITQLSNAAAEIEGVRRVISLPVIKDAVDMGGTWDLNKFQKVVSHIALIDQNLLSSDLRATALTLVLKTDVDPSAVIQRVDTLIQSAGKELSLYQIGMPLISEALARLTQRDFMRLPPVTLVIIFFMLLLLLRNMRLLAIPLMCVGLAMIWTFGLMALVRIPLSMLTMIVPVFLIAVGTAYCLHVGAEYGACAQHRESSREATLATFSYVSFPTSLAVLTTIIGLLSLIVNRIPTIREFAVFACFGMFSLLVMVLTLLPAVLSLLPLPDGRKRDFYRTPGFVRRWVAAVIHLNLNRQGIVLPLIGLLTVFCIIGIFRLRVETNPVGYFKADTPVKQHFDDISRVLSGSFPVNVVVSHKDPDYFEDPAHIETLSRLQAFLESLPGVDKTLSFADYMKLVNYALNQYDPQAYTLPQEGFEVRMAMNNYTTMLGQDMFDRFMSADRSTANIVLLTHISSSRDFLALREQILDHLKTDFDEDLTWTVTGFGISISASSHHLTNGQLKSLSLTLVLVFGIMFLLFISFKVGVVAIIVNMFPIVVNFGIMGWVGIELSMATSLIASIAIGLAVDDTIHYLVRYNQEFQKDLNDERALHDTLHQVGPPIMYTTITISLGFAVLVFSGFIPTAVFGAMMVITMLAALVGDMILLPSLMQHIELVTLWDLVRLKLGRETSQKIPLFAGLSRTEIHYILMAGTLQKLEPGEILFKKGDPSESMYTIISGTMDVIDSKTPLVSDGKTCTDLMNQRLLNRMHPGEVLGEMGLLRAAPRSATVIASQAVELLPINWKMIKRLQWLYPPTSRKFLYNLLSIICERVERLSDCLADIKTVDDASGLHNRDNFLRLLEYEIRRSQRYQIPVAVGFLDVTLQNAEGGFDMWQRERFVREICESITRHLRSTDILGRWDTLRFALLFPHTSGVRARAVCRRLQAILESEAFGTDDTPLQVGFKATELRADPEEAAPNLLDRAVDALEQTTL